MVRKLAWPVEGPGSILSTIKTKTKHHSSSTWRHRPIIPACRRLQQKDHKFQASGATGAGGVFMSVGPPG